MDFVDPTGEQTKAAIGQYAYAFEGTRLDRELLYHVMSLREQIGELTTAVNELDEGLKKIYENL